MYGVITPYVHIGYIHTSNIKHNFMCITNLAVMVGFSHIAFMCLARVVAGFRLILETSFLLELLIRASKSVVSFAIALQQYYLMWSAQNTTCGIAVMLADHAV